MNRYWETVLDLDRRMREAGIDYCIIKSYNANIDYFDSNIDVVVLIPLEEAYSRAYPDRIVTTKDRIKAKFYEHNKLMLTDPARHASEIHLHTNAGWHDCEFVSGEEIMASRIGHELEGQSIQITGSDTERKILTLHQIFENFFKKRWDNFYIGEDDYDAFAKTYGISAEQIARVKSAGKFIPIKDLVPIWRLYYKEQRRQKRSTRRNEFLHMLTVGIFYYRKMKA